MDCWIEVAEVDDLRVVRVAGSIRDEHVPDLLAACGHASGRLRVDLTEVRSVDAIGVDALRRVRDGGAELSGVSMYIQLKLESLTPTPRGRA